MEKSHALFIALMITLVIAGNWLFFVYDFNEGREEVIISRVLDGDTVELEDGRKVRLLNINAEEKGRVWSVEAGDFLKSFLNETVELEVSGVDSYGRILGRLFQGDIYLNLELVRLGLAHKYIVEEFELSDFSKAEKNAREEEIGIWKKSENYGCLDVEINKKDEYIVIEDNCGVDFKDWSVKDESTRWYKFEESFGKEEFVLFSGKGDDLENELYWGRGKVWNDDKDSIFIRDEQGFLVYYDFYGY